MKLVDIREVFGDYKKTSLLLSVKTCDYKCCIEGNFNINICHNYHLDSNEEKEISPQYIWNKVNSNPLIQGVIFAGKEPMLDIYFEDMLKVIKEIRENSNIDIVIFTGYYEKEIPNKIEELKKYKNIVVKFGRYIPNRNSIFSDVLGTTLASDNQYAVKIS